MPTNSNELLDMLEQYREDLQGIRDRFRNIILRNADGIIIVDRDGVVRFVNPASETLLGRPADDLLGQVFGFPIVAGETTELDVIGRAGVAKMVEMRVVETEWEGKPAHLASLRDITRRRRSEEEIRFQAQLLDAVEQAVVAIDLAGVIVYWSRSAETVYGWPAAEVLGRPVLDVVLAQEDVEQVQQALSRLWQGNSWSGELFVQRRDGTLFSALLSAAPVYDTQGSIIGAVAVSADISERKQAEESLAWEAGTNAAIAELAKALISSVKPDDISLLVLQHAKRLTGSSFGYVGYIDPQSGSLVCPTMTREIWDSCQVPGKDFVFETFAGLWGWVLENRQSAMVNDLYQDSRSTGTPPGHLPIQRFISAPALADGMLVGQIALANPGRDYTEQDLVLVERLASLYALAVQRERRENALQQAKERVDNTLESIRDGFFTLNNELVVTYFNQAAEQLLGRKADQVLGRELFDAFPEAKGSIFEEKYTEALRKKQALSFETYFGVEPYENWYDANVYPYEDGISVYFQVTTERKRTEAALYKRNRELALLNQVGQELAATLDRQEAGERLLEAVTDIIGAEGASVWLRDEQERDRLTCWAFFHQDLDVLPLADLHLHISQGIVGWVARTGKSAIVPRAADESHFFAGIDRLTHLETGSLLAVPLHVRGKTLGVIEVVNKQGDPFDDDDRSLVETLAASAAIAIDNAQLVENLQRSTAELERRNEELDAFAHTVAHDLKGPLGTVIGFAETLEMNRETLSDEDLDRYLHTLARRGRKMGNIIDELILLSGLRQMKVEMRPLDMGSIVAEAQDRLEDLINEYQAEIELPDTWPRASGYAPWVEEVWVNYMSNAIKYGGQPPHIELGAAKGENGAIQFWIRDNGAGITPEEQSRLFKPFTRLDQARAKGHGLGLSVARSIVEKLDGEVGVESVVGQGSVFSFTLPSAQE